MTDHSFDKVAVAIEKQGKAFKTFSKRQDERFDDVTKRVEKLEAKGIVSVTDAPGQCGMTDEHDDQDRESAHRLAAILERVTARVMAEYGLSSGAVSTGCLTAAIRAARLEMSAESAVTRLTKGQGGNGVF